ncbi:uncharacterized protein MP3633_1603 [Marinomonas primoryensis]|uniref:Uncharacterized protein n=1 Tax=Marinomonas primoryensis TaxID=178399 RepID=A0A859CV28_9GAMM|nr:uncharacterized protein MP3633_1603 [Marinomonas primoryensis]
MSCKDVLLPDGHTLIPDSIKRISCFEKKDKQLLTTYVFQENKELESVKEDASKYFSLSWKPHDTGLFITILELFRRCFK